MHPENIKAALRIRYGSLKAFEAAKNLPAGSVWDVLRGRAVRRTAEAMAKELGLPVTTVFPGRFLNSPDNTSRKPDSHRLNRQAV